MNFGSGVWHALDKGDKDRGTIHKHSKSLQEIFDSLATLEDPITEKKRVMS